MQGASSQKILAGVCQCAAKGSVGARYLAAGGQRPDAKGAILLAAHQPFACLRPQASIRDRLMRARPTTSHGGWRACAIGGYLYSFIPLNVA